MRLASALILGFIAGTRSMLAPAAASRIARLSHNRSNDRASDWMSKPSASLVFFFLALGEVMADKLPGMASRTVAPAFAARVASGALSGATVAGTPFGLVLGAAGAVAGTLGGASLRGRLADELHADLPAAIFEDLAALILVSLTMMEISDEPDRHTLRAA